MNLFSNLLQAASAGTVNDHLTSAAATIAAVLGIKSLLFLGDTPVAVFFPLTSSSLLPEVDRGSKYKLFTATSCPPGLWSSPILTSDPRLGAAGLTDMQL